jgi:hypothetical protein
MIAGCALLLAHPALARAVVYGSDDRVDVGAEADPARRARATASTAALIVPWQLRFDAGGFGPTGRPAEAPAGGCAVSAPAASGRGLPALLALLALPWRRNGGSAGGREARV